jgi:hypothetical protein
MVSGTDESSKSINGFQQYTAAVVTAPPVSGDFAVGAVSFTMPATVIANRPVIVYLYGDRYQKRVRKDLSVSTPSGQDVIRKIAVHAIVYKR